jgi:stage II sporulation protein P
MPPHFRRRTPSFKSTHSQFLRKLTLFVMVGFILIFALTSMGSFVQSKLNLSSSTLKKWTNHISIETFVTALSMEIPQLQTYNKSKGIENPRASTMIFEMVTSFNPKDPRSLIRRELPGFAFFDGQITVAGQDVGYTDFPTESAPPMEVLMGEREATLNGSDAGEARDQTPDKTPILTTEGRKVVFIYHTHNRESWLPHLPDITDPDDAYHKEVNITLVGERLSEELEKRGIGTYLDITDIAQRLNDTGKKFEHSYDQSKEIVQAVIAEQEHVQFIFDLHRDSLPRDKTTIEIDGKSYARTFFVIGTRNSNYERNEKFAARFHQLLEEAYPGLSRGIFLQPKGHGEYNQSLSDKNIIIEIGGVENTLEESYRTVEALAEVIADLYWDAEKVDTKPEDRKS